MKAKLSIIVPIFQGEEYIENCINSISSQIENGIELVLIDDGSKDNSWISIMSYAEKYDWIKAIHHDNRGVSYTRNQGIRNATGEYVWFVDVDDVILPNSIKEISTIIQEFSPDIIVFGYKSKLARKQLNEFDTVPTVKRGLYTEGQVKDVFWSLYKQNLIHNIGTKIYKTKLIKENGNYFDENLKIYEDALFCVSVIQKTKKIYVSNNVLYCYNLELNKNSLSHGYKENFILGVNNLFAKIEEIFQPSEEFYFSYLCALKSVVDNEFRKRNFTFLDYKELIENIWQEKIYSGAKEHFPEVINRNIYWTNIEKRHLFTCYIKSWLTVKKSNVLQSRIINYLFDSMYSIYRLLFKGGKNKNDD